MDMSKLFSDYIKKEENYNIAYDIVRQNSKGKIWLIGGGVSRNLNQLIHGTSQKSFDFDFIVEEGNENIVLPDGWETRMNRFGNPKFIKGDMEIDFIPIKKVRYIIEKNLDATIENVLAGSPFTIQDLAYDTEAEEIIGDKGIDALERQVFEVLNLETAKFLAEIRGVELNEIILEKAKSMGFKAIIPNE